MSNVVSLIRYSDEATRWATERTWGWISSSGCEVFSSSNHQDRPGTSTATPPPKLNGYLEFFPRDEADRARSWRLALWRS